MLIGSELDGLLRFFYLDRILRFSLFHMRHNTLLIFIFEGMANRLQGVPNRYMIYTCHFVRLD